MPLMADLAKSADACPSWQTLLTVVLGTLLMVVSPCEYWWVLCVEGICNCVALLVRGIWGPEILEFLPAPNLKTFWVKWLADGNWTLPSCNNVLWLWFLFISNTGSTGSQSTASVSEVLVPKKPKSVDKLLHRCSSASILWHTVECLSWIVGSFSLPVFNFLKRMWVCIHYLPVYPANNNWIDSSVVIWEATVQNLSTVHDGYICCGPWHYASWSIDSFSCC